MKQAAGTTQTVDPFNVQAPATPAARPGTTRYSRVAVLLHWLIAALVLSTIPLGLYSASNASPAPGSAPGMAPGPAGMAPAAGAGPRPPAPPPKSPRQQAATNLHKTVGVLILFLTFVRVGWRLAHQPPALPAGLSRALRGLAKTSHALFYGLLLAMPISGWWMSSAVPSPRRHAFGLGIFDIPFLPVAQSWPAAAAARYVHTNLIWLMVGLIVLHVLAALKHHCIDKDDVLLRMLPRKR